MNVIDRLAQIVRDHEESQKAIAMEWIQHMTKVANTVPKPSTVESRLSELVAGKTKGMKFFLGTGRARATAFWDVVGVDEAERESLASEVEGILTGGTPRPADLVFDLSNAASDRDTADSLFVSVENLLRVAPRLRPAVVVVTMDQYRYLPRTFDDFGDAVRVERVKDESAGEALVRTLVGERGLLISDRPLVPASRWAATSVWHELDLSPSDALTRYQSSGRLDDIEGVEHSVSELLTKDSANPDTAREVSRLDPHERRDLMRRLTIESEAGEIGGIERRAGLAAALGVLATSTRRERIEHELAQLASTMGVLAKRSDEAGLAELLSRAERRPVTETFLRVNDELHVVNGGGVYPDHPRLKLHRVECPTPAITSLRNAIADWSEDEFLSDRDLSKVIESLVSDGVPELLLHHARETLLHNGLVSLVEKRSFEGSQWAVALGLVLDGATPPASARLVSFEDSDPDDQWDGRLPYSPRPSYETWDTTMATRDAVSSDRLPIPLPLVVDRDGQFVWIGDDAEGAHGRRNARMDSRRERMTVTGPGGWNMRDQGWSFEMSSTSVQNAVRQFLIPVHPKNVSADVWLDAVDGSHGLGGSAEAAASLIKRDGVALLPHPDGFASSKAEPISGDVAFWQEADQQVLFVWHALKAAIDADRPCMIQHDGVAFLDLGRGLVAELRVRRFGAEDRPVTAALRLKYTGYGGLSTGSMLREPRAGWPALPRCVHIRGMGWAVDVRFATTSLRFGRD